MWWIPISLSIYIILKRCGYEGSTLRVSFIDQIFPSEKKKKKKLLRYISSVSYLRRNALLLICIYGNHFKRIV